MNNIGNLMYMGRKKLKSTFFKENKRWGINFLKRLPDFNTKSLVKAVPGSCSAKWVVYSDTVKLSEDYKSRWMDRRVNCVAQQATTQLLQDGSFLLFLFLFCFFVLFGLGSSFKFDLGLWGRLQSHLADLKRWEDKRDQNASFEIHKESIKIKQTNK